MDAIETIDVRGLTVELHYDDDPYNPLIENDNAWTFIGDSGCRFGLNEKRAWADFSDPDCLAQIRGSSRDLVAVLRADDYGSQGGGLYRVDDLADCNAAAILSAQQLADEWKGDREAAYRYLDAVIKEYQSYLDGEVYYFTVSDGDEVIDSCGGFIGDIEYCRSEAVTTAEYHADDRDHRNLLRGLSQVACAGMAV